MEIFVDKYVYWDSRKHGIWNNGIISFMTSLHIVAAWDITTTGILVCISHVHSRGLHDRAMILVGVVYVLCLV